MRVDIVCADDGYFGIYLDGDLEFWGHEDNLRTLEEVLEDKPPVDRFVVHGLGGYGISATEYEDIADRFEEIPARWWDHEQYEYDEAS